MKRAKFVSPDNDEFYRALRKRVNRYFKEKNLKKTGNIALYIKATILFSTLMGPLMVMVFSPHLPLVVFYSLWLLMGVGMAGIGLSVMHEAVHGSFSPNRKVNDFLGHASMFFVGGFAENWRIQHNQLHHTYTNVADLDEDINPAFAVVRLSPEFPLKPAHKFQYIYAWFLYCLMTLMWVTTKDFSQLLRFKRQGFYDNRSAEYIKEWIRLILFKVFYYTIFVGLLLNFTSYSLLVVITGFLSMHFIAGFILGIVFQPAHVTTRAQFPETNEEDNIENSWAAHQLITTQNFAMNNRWLSWYVGGLNFQIEHHLFPTISHIHFKELSKIVQEVVKDYELPYYSQPTFRAAIVDHAKMLMQLGKK